MNFFLNVCCRTMPFISWSRAVSAQHASFFINYWLSTDIILSYLFKMGEMDSATINQEFTVIGDFITYYKWLFDVSSCCVTINYKIYFQPTILYYQTAINEQLLRVNATVSACVPTSWSISFHPRLVMMRS